MNNNQNEFLLYVSIKSVKNISNQKLINPSLNVYVRRLSNSENDGMMLSSKLLNWKELQCAVNEKCLALCNKQDFLELQLYEDTLRSAYMKFPLERMVEMPRVTHEIQCKLLKSQKWDSLDKSMLNHTAEVSFELIAFNKLLGKLVISSIEAELTRNTETVGQMDPYVEFALQGEKRKTQVRDNEGMHCIWKQRIVFELTDVNKGFILSVVVLDKDNLSSDIVGSINLDLIKENMLLPKEEIRQRIFDIKYDNESAGKVKIQYQFVPKQFNF